jgi:hypothetical protein
MGKLRPRSQIQPLPQPTLAAKEIKRGREGERERGREGEGERERELAATFLPQFP